MGKPVNRTLEIAAIGKDASGIGHVAGPVVTFRGKGDPLRSLLVNIDPVQDLHGYDNPWPAGGGVNIFGNISAGYFDATGAVHVPSANLEFYTVDYYPTGSNTAGMLQIWATNPDADAWCGVACYDENKTFMSRAIGTRAFDSSGYANQTVTFPTGTKYIRISMRTFGSDKIMFELGSTATPYAPYSNICPISGWSEVNVWVKPTYDPTANPTATIQLGQTVYGGTLDVTNGVLTVDRAMVDMGTLNWAYNSTASAFESVGVSSLIKSRTIGVVPNIICSSLETKTGYNVYTSGNGIGQDGTKLRAMYTGAGTDAAVFKTAMSGVQLVYELDTPITIQLTPTQITTLQGQNNLWADSGDVDVMYSASGGPGGKLAILLRERKELLIALKMGMTQAEAGLLGSLPGVSLGSGLSSGIIRPGASTQDEDEEEEIL